MSWVSITYSDISIVRDKVERLEDQLSHPSLGFFLNPGPAPSCQLIPQGSPDVDETQFGRYIRPCSRTNVHYTGAVPPFIGQDYFCETGNRYYPAQRQWYHADPLWDGSGCGSTSSCCGFNNPPWFCKQLPQPTTNDIEMQLCIDSGDENVIIESVEIYVQ